VKHSKNTLIFDDDWKYVYIRQYEVGDFEIDFLSKITNKWHRGVGMTLAEALNAAEANRGRDPIETTNDELKETF